MRDQFADHTWEACCLLLMRVTIIVRRWLTHVHWLASRGTVGVYLRRSAVANRLIRSYPVFIAETVRLANAAETGKSSVIFGML